MDSQVFESMSAYLTHLQLTQAHYPRIHLYYLINAKPNHLLLKLDFFTARQDVGRGEIRMFLLVYSTYKKPSSPSFGNNILQLSEEVW